MKEKRGQGYRLLYLIFAFILFISVFSQLALIRAQVEDTGLQVDMGAWGGIFNTDNPSNYILSELTRIARNNPIVNSIDSFFTGLEYLKIFMPLFGVHWESTSENFFAILLSVLLWILMLFYIKRQFYHFFEISKLYSYLYSLVCVLVLAHLKAFIAFSEKVFLVITSIKSNVFTSIILIVIIIGLFFLDFWILAILTKRKNERFKAKLNKIDTGVRISEAMARGAIEGNRG